MRHSEVIADRVTTTLKVSVEGRDTEDVNTVTLTAGESVSTSATWRTVTAELIKLPVVVASMFVST